MFKGNLDCLIFRKGAYNLAGEQSFGPGIKARCSIVEITSKLQHTTVRADSSATRGFAEEAAIEAKILFPTSTDLKLDDRIDVEGLSIRVVGKFPRRDVNGRLDHYEILGAKWD